jgi:hypothetical protein
MTTVKHAKQDSCPHNSIQRKRGMHEINMYVCGSCAALFDVKEYSEPKPSEPEPISKNRVPWGLRSRQA